MHVSNRCVAVVDILGFRERLRSGKLLELAQLLDDLVAHMPSITTRWTIFNFRPGLGTQFFSGCEKIHKLLFSDTLLLWSDPMPQSSERQHARTTSFLMSVAYVIGAALLNGLPLRAGVAYGPVLVQARKRIVIGQPLVDAYLTEGVQEWVGGAIHESYPRHPNSYDFSYPVPVKRGTSFVLSRAIEWTQYARGAFDSEAETINKNLPRLERALQSGIDSASSASVRRKYANAALFMSIVSDYWERARDVY